MKPSRSRKLKRLEEVEVLLDQDVLVHFRANEPGWKRRINGALRRALRLRPSSKSTRAKPTAKRPAKSAPAKPKRAAAR
jgi:BrnA antitoxin of type II toxin-antitoxin system